jgi:NitT/TauT family transport system ATP-binding protein
MSGCGKSTLLRYVCGLQKPTSGEVLIRGKPRDDSVRVGMVFQQYSSFPWLSVLDNVALGMEYKGMAREERCARAMEMIRVVGLEGHEHKFAKYPTLSGGQLQRVAIARSLVADPEILLMDEPFGALDINTRLRMQDLLCEIWSKLQTTVVFVTHDIAEAVYLADEIHIMRANPGKIVERIVVPLPFERSRETKRTPEFTGLVRMVEDRMIDLELAIQTEAQSAQKS